MPYANPFISGRSGARLLFAAFLTLAYLLLPETPGVFAAGDPPFALPSQEELNKIKTAVIYTSKGEVRFELFPEEAPWHVANFKYRADKGLYRDTAFHIFYADYIIQGGGPRSKPDTPASYQIPAEFNRRLHVFGALGMARRPDVANPQRASSGNQFHILLGEAPRMNGNFTVFGQIVSGEAVLENLRQSDVINDVRVFVRGH